MIPVWGQRGGTVINRAETHSSYIFLCVFVKWLYCCARCGSVAMQLKRHAYLGRCNAMLHTLKDTNFLKKQVFQIAFDPTKKLVDYLVWQYGQNLSVLKKTWGVLLFKICANFLVSHNIVFIHNHTPVEGLGPKLTLILILLVTNLIALN